MDHPTRLYVPATLANLGSGFDALGVALDLYLEVEAEPAREVAEALPRARRLLQEGRVPPAFLLR